MCVSPRLLGSHLSEQWVLLSASKTKKEKPDLCWIYCLPWLTLHLVVSQNAELGRMVSSAACRAHPAASRTAATMWQEGAIAYQDTQEPTVIKVGINISNYTPIFNLNITYSNNLIYDIVLQFVQLATMANCALKCVSTVPTTPHATPGTVTVNVCLAGLQPTAPYVSATLYSN